MPANLPNEFFALATTVGLLDEHLDFIGAWIRLQQQMRDRCPDCPGPGDAVVNSALAAMNVALRAASEAVSQISEQQILSGSEQVGA